MKRPTLMQFATKKDKMPHEFDMRSYCVALNKYIDYLEKILRIENRWVVADNKQSGDK